MFNSLEPACHGKLGRAEFLGRLSAHEVEAMASVSFEPHANAAG